MAYTLGRLSIKLSESVSYSSNSTDNEASQQGRFPVFCEFLSIHLGKKEIEYNRRRPYHVI